MPSFGQLCDLVGINDRGDSSLLPMSTLHDFEVYAELKLHFLTSFLTELIGKYRFQLMAVLSIDASCCADYKTLLFVSVG